MSGGGWQRAVCVGIVVSASCGQASLPPAAVDADASRADVNAETSPPDAAPDKDARDGKKVDAAVESLGDAGSDRADALQEHAGDGPTDGASDQGASTGVVRADDGSWRLPSPADLRSIWGTGDGDVWAVGDHGTIVHWDGKTWSFAASNVSVNLLDVYGFGANDVWAVGAAGTSLHWNGSSWTADSSGAPPAAVLHAVWGVSAADVWAVGAGVIRHWDGSKWSPIEAPAVGTSELYDVWGPADDDVWTVGDRGTILHWDGEAWTARVSGATNDLRCVVARGASGAWAVGFGNSSALWTGTDWLLQPIAQQPNDILAASGTSASDRWFVGLQGWIRYFDGEFSNYVRATNPAAEDLTGVWAHSTNDVWAVGTGGAILRWDSRLMTSYALRDARRSQ